MASLAYRRWLGGFAISLSLLVPALSATAPGCDNPPFPEETDDKDGVNPVPSPSKDDSVGPGLGGSTAEGGGGGGGGAPPVPCTDVSMCEDDDLCTDDSCENDVCVNADRANDGDACTEDSCNPRTGDVTHLPTGVDDNDACTYTCDPATGATQALSVAFFSTDFEDDTGWMLGPQWFIGSAAPSVSGLAGGNDPPNDFSTTGMDGIAGTAQGALVAPQATTSFLVSPPIDIPADVLDTEAVTLSFMRWLNAAAPPEMATSVEAFNCGSMAFEVLWSSTGQVIDSKVNNTVVQGTEWFEIRLDMTAAAQACKTMGQPTNVRFGFNKGTATPSIGGWNIDDLKISKQAVAVDGDICTLDTCDSVGPPPGTPVADADDINIDDGDAETFFSCDPGTGPAQNPNP